MINMLLQHNLRTARMLKHFDIPIIKKYGYEFVIIDPDTNDPRIELWGLEKLDNVKTIQLKLIRMGGRMLSERVINRLMLKHYNMFLKSEPKPISTFNPGNNSGIKHVRKARGLPKKR